jgi:hypothetical protein
MQATTITDTISAARPPSPSRRSLFGAGAALLAGGAALAVPARGAVAGRGAGTTRIAALNRRIYELSVRRNELEDIWLALPEGPEEDAANKAFDDTLYDILDLQDQVVELPAETLQDVAIQATISFYRAEKLHSCALSESKVIELGKELCRLQVSILMVVVKTANLEIDRIGWGDMRSMHDVHSAAGRAAA